MHLTWTYSPEMLKSGQNWHFVVSHDHEIGQITLNKANLRDLIAATGLVILLKLDSNRPFFARVTPKNNKAHPLYYIKLCVSFQIPSVNSNWSYSPETPNLGQIP